MHQRNKTWFLVTFILLAAVWTLAQTAAPAPQSNAPAATQPPSQQTTPAQAAPQQPAAGQTPSQPAGGQPQQEEPAPAPAPNQPGDTVQVPPGEAPSGQQNDVYIFKKEVDEVTLHATVVDD